MQLPKYFASVQKYERLFFSVVLYFFEAKRLAPQPYSKRPSISRTSSVVFVFINRARKSPAPGNPLT